MKIDVQMSIVLIGVCSKCLVQRKRKHVYQVLGTESCKVHRLSHPGMFISPCSFLSWYSYLQVTIAKSMTLLLEDSSSKFQTTQQQGLELSGKLDEIQKSISLL